MIRFTLLFAALALVQVNTFAQWSPLQIIDPPGLYQDQVVTGDIDNDGDMDVVSSAMTPTQDGKVLMVHNYDHVSDHFTFLLLSYVAPYSPAEHYLQLADLDGNGFIDIIFSFSNGAGNPRITNIYFNNGTGAFTEPIVFQAQAAYYSLLVMDIDADDDTDLLVLTFNTLEFYLNDGQGNFAPSAPAYTAFEMTGHSLLPCDLDGDAYPDFAIHKPYEEFILFQNNGQQVFDPVEIPISSGIRLADFNSDGIDDLVLRWGSYLNVRLNIGGTVFANPIQTNALFTSGITDHWQVLDLDSDGDMDIVVTSSDSNVDPLTFWMNDGDLLFTSVVPGEFEFCEADVELWEHDGILFILAPCNRLYRYKVTTGPTLKLEGSLSNYIAPPNMARPYLTDMDMDGTMDLAIANINEASVWWYPDIRNNVGGQRFLYHVDDIVMDLGVADVNQDGAPDLIVETFDGVHVHWNLGDDQFSGPEGNSVGKHAFDLDGDGDLDLLQDLTPYGMSPKLYRNMGNNNFSPITLLSASNFISYRFVQALDMDGDGLLDVIYNGGGSNRVWKNLGNFSFSAPVDMPISYEVLPIDCDLDGDMDIITTNVAPGDFSLYRNLSGDLFQAQAEEILNSSCSSCFADIFDENNDGYPDFLFHEDNASYLMLNDGQCNFGTPVIFYPGLSIPKARKVLDMDLDGDEDILFLQAFQGRSQLVWIENFALHPNTVSGQVFADINADGQPDASDPGIPMAILSVQPTAFIQFSEESGAFTVYSELGPQVVSVNLNNPFWSLSTGASSISVDLTNEVPHVDSLLFGFTPVVDTSIVEVTIEVASSTCNAVTTMWVNMANLGTRSETSTLSMIMDEDWTFISSEPAPAYNSNGVLVWDPQVIEVFQSRSISLQLQVPDVDQIGIQLTDTLTITSTDLMGENEMNFTTTSTYVNDCAYDPNDKQVEPTGFGIIQAIPLETESLTYTIRFQNTGTALATDVTLRDQLHPTLIPTGITVVGASHDVSQVYVEADNELVVKFNSIMLPDSASDMAGSQGYFKFRIPIAEGLPHLTEVENTASIYFDLNPPIITNTTNTLLVDCQLWTPSITSATDTLIASEGNAYQWFLDGLPLPDETQRTLIVEQSGVYTVAVTSLYGCVTVSDEHMIVSAGSSLEQDGVTVFPNPVDDHVTLIHALILDDDHSIELIDMVGRTLRVMSGNGSTRVEINTTDLADGVYIIKHTHLGQTKGSWRIVKGSTSK